MRRELKGFSIVELVIVIVVLGILAAIAIPRFIDLQSITLEAVQLTNSANVKSALAMAIGRDNTEPSVTVLASLVNGENVVAQDNGVQLEIKGENYLVPTYKDNACSVPTENKNETVLCVGNISSS